MVPTARRVDNFVVREATLNTINSFTSVKNVNFIHALKTCAVAAAITQKESCVVEVENDFSKLTFLNSRRTATIIIATGELINLQNYLSCLTFDKIFTK